MAKTSPKGSSSRRSSLFARRQVYVRAGQDSQYVELSPMLQIGVAIGFVVFAFWLIGASYSAVTGYLDKTADAELLARLESTQQALTDAESARDAALVDNARLVDLEAELAQARTTAGDSDATVALAAELEQTKAQLEETRVRLSEAKADQAALQARIEAEALATSDASVKTAEEAASLHAQLEDAFADMEALQKDRDELTARLTAAEEENLAKVEAAERNTALLKAATAEIERLQQSLSLAESEGQSADREHESTIARLEAERDEAAATVEQADLVRTELEGRIEALNAELDAARTAARAVETTEATDAIDSAEHQAALLAQSIAAGLQEADLLAEIDDLRAGLGAGARPTNTAAIDGSADVDALRARVAVAEAEIERLILAGLNADDETAVEAPPVIVPSPADAEEAERLRAELLEARAEIIKLNADVKAARQRLAEQAESDSGQASRPDNSAKLEQQLASTRSRVQQLNKALADAKLREVAIDLALISVVPTPSPPAPR